MPASERDFFDEGNVLVTNSRFVVYGQTYAMANITSVMHHVDSSRRDGVGGLGIFLLVGSLVYPVIEGGDVRHILGLTMIGVGGAVLLLIIAWFIPVAHKVKITTSGGEVQALRIWGQGSSGFIDCVVAAINQAIIERG